MKDGRNHIGVLDGLRAMAILLVMASHGLDLAWPDMRQPFLPIGRMDLAAFLKNGWTGVDLFFVLSGFLITGQLLDGGIAAKENRGDVIRRYLKRRIYRIVPAYYVVLTLWTAALMVSDPLKRSALRWAYSYIPHLLFLHNFFYADYNPVFWSLAVEFQFYLLAPFFILLLLRIKQPASRHAALCAVIFLLAALRMLAVLHWQAGETSFNYWAFNIRILFPFSLDGILGGMLCSFLWHDEKIRKILQRINISNGLFFGGLFLYLALTCMRPLEAGVTLFDKTAFTLLVSAAFSSILLGLLAGSAGQWLFASRPLRHVALVSYSMYLLHLVVMRDLFNLALPLTMRFHSHFVNFFGFYAIFVAITVFFPRSCIISLKSRS